jgi:hypothetical protein
MTASGEISGGLPEFMHSDSHWRFVLRGISGRRQPLCIQAIPVFAEE